MFLTPDFRGPISRGVSRKLGPPLTPRFVSQNDLKPSTVERTGETAPRLKKTADAEDPYEVWIWLASVWLFWVPRPEFPKKAEISVLGAKKKVLKGVKNRFG